MLTLLVMSWGVTPAMAQTHNKAVIAALDTIVRNYSIELNKKVHQFVENKWLESKKDPEIAVGIAQAYVRYFKENPRQRYYNFATKDTARAFQYIDRAIEADAKYAPAYVRAGNIRLAFEDTIKALEWYQRGIDANPSAPDCYLSYAKILLEKEDTTGALTLMKQINKSDPVYPAERDIARTFDDIIVNRMNVFNIKGKAEEYEFICNCYRNTDLNQMSYRDFYTFAYYLDALGENELAYHTAVAGLETVGSYPQLYRYAMYGAIKSGRTDEALLYGDSLFRNDTISFKYRDYVVFATALQSKHRLKESGEWYMKAYRQWAMDEPEFTLSTDRRAGREIINAAVGMYKFEGLFDEGKEIANVWIKDRVAANKVSANDVLILDGVYDAQIAESFGMERIQLRIEQDSILKYMGEVDTLNLFLSFYRRLPIAEEIDTVMHTNREFELALEIEKAWENLEDKEDAQAKSIYFRACNNFYKYYQEIGLQNRAFCRDAWLKALEYLRKMLEIYPTNTAVKSRYEQIKNWKPIIRC